HLAARVLVFDLARDAHAVHLRHHHQEPPGDAQVTRDRRALGAHALLEDLHRDLVAAPEAILDGRALAPRRLAPDALGLVAVLAGDVVDDHLLLTHFKPSWGRCRVPQVDRRFGRSTCAYRQGAQAQVAASKQAATCGTLCDRICTADPCGPGLPHAALTQNAL